MTILFNKKNLALTCLLLVGSIAFFLSIDRNSPEEPAWSISSDVSFFENEYKKKPNHAGLLAAKELLGMEQYKVYTDFVSNIPAEFDPNFSYLIVYRFSPGYGIVELTYVTFSEVGCEFSSKRYLPHLSVTGFCSVEQLPFIDLKKEQINFSMDGKTIGFYASEKGEVIRKLVSVSNTNYLFPETGEDVLRMLDVLM